ncbi:MAG: HAMP domain-containing sensor histidine kinase [Bryobacteraceae bacterium]
MSLRTRLLLMSVSTVAVIVTVLAAIHINSLMETWLDATLDLSAAASRHVQAAVIERVTDRNVKGATTQSLDEVKLAWRDIVISDREVARAMANAMMDSRGIAEINIVGEYGTVLASSNLARVGSPVRTQRSLPDVLDLGPIGRFAAIFRSEADFETRTPIGFADQGKPVFQVQLLVSPALLRTVLAPQLKSTGIASLFAVLVAAALAVLSANIALRPLERIGEAIDTLATGNPLGLVTPQTDREVAIIESRLNLLGEQMHGAREAVASLMRGAAHEIKNPLNAMALRLETLRGMVADDVPEADVEIGKLSAEVSRLDRVVKLFLDLGRPVELELRDFDLRKLIDEAADLVRPGATAHAIELEWERPEPPFPVRADYGLIQQGLLNVLNNAIEAMPDGGRVRVSVWRVGLHCEIRVTDNGPGMTPVVRDRIFEPYFTTKEKGSGIGLALTRKMLQLHGGTASVESDVGKGTTMILSLPVVWSRGS